MLTMGKPTAVSAYLRALIEGQPELTFAGVFRQAGQAPNYLLRLESGDTKDPRARGLLAVVLAARGSLEDVARLLLDDTATPEDGRAAAEAYLTAAAARATPEHRQAVAEELRQLADRLESGEIAVPRRGLR